MKFHEHSWFSQCYMQTDMAKLIGLFFELAIVNVPKTGVMSFVIF
jgi:hypothetical protein